MGQEIGTTAIKNQVASGWTEPVHYQLPGDNANLAALIASGNVIAIHDTIVSALDELYDIEQPSKKDSKDQADVQSFIDSKTNGQTDNYGEWIFFPWTGRLVHFPPKAELRALRTSRNRNLITELEQSKLYEATILVVGMSVGSNVIEALLAQGTAGKLIMADMDTLDPSNLNRIRSPYHQLGLHKVDAIAQKVSEIDPYIEQIHYKEGLNEENLTRIITESRPDIIIDEMDNIAMKLKLRLQARDAKIPVIMAADDGDNVLLDIERYDLHDALPLLHGKIPQDVIDRILGDAPIPRAELGMMIGKYFVGFENTPLRMFESLREVGKSLPSWPQLGGAAALAGIILAYCSKKIILKHSLAEGRFILGPDEQLDPEIYTDGYKSKLEIIINSMSSKLL